MLTNKETPSILVVEDETVIATDLAKRLIQLGYAVCGRANTTDAALELVREHRPDLVMMDVALGGAMGGIEAAELIREQWNIPVVFLTGIADDDRIKRAKLTYPLGYLLKPFQERELRITVEMALYVADVDKEKRRAETALQESEAKFKLLYQQAPLPYQSLNEEGDFIEVNQSWLNTLGYTRDEVIGRNFGDFLHRDWVDHFRENFPRFKAIGEILGVEFEMVKKDGSTILVAFNGKIGRDDQGRFRQTHCIFRDITDQKIAEEALRESEAKYRLLADNIRDTIWIRDMDQNLTFVSSSTERLRGYAPEEVLTQSLDEILTPDSAKLARDTYDRMVRQNQEEDNPPDEYTMALEHRCKDGRTVWLEVRISYIRDSEGKPVGILGVNRDITDRQKAMESLRYERDMNERVMETSPAGIVHVNADGQVVYANKRAEDILGIQLSESVERTYDDPAWKVTGFKGEPFPNENLPFQIVKRTGKPVFGVRHAIEWPNGRRVLLAINAAPLFDKSGLFEGMVATIEDITDHWKTKEEYETLFREMLDGFALHEIICDSKGKPVDYRFLAVNPAFERMTGLKGESIIGKTVLEVLPGIEPYWIETYGNVALTGEPVFFENYTQGLDKYFQVTAYQPVPNRFACIFSDITDRKKAEAELRMSEERFSQFMHNYPGVAFIKDDKGRYVYANRSYGTENDPSPEARIGKTDREIFPPEIADLYMENDRIVYETGKPVEVVEKAYQNNEVRHQIVNKFPIEYGNNKTFLGGLTLDITERIRAEEEKEKLQIQLQQAQKMEAVGTLAGGIAHDFNNLLQAISGYSELLVMDKEEQDPDYGNIIAIQEAGLRASNLVRQLLLFSRKADTERKPVDLNHEIEQARKMLERAIPKMVKIHVHASGRLWPVNADPVQIEQIVLNLGINAADAMPDGGTLLIETENVTLDREYAHTHLDSNAGRYVLLTVSDTGHGMNEETAKKIFEPFFTTKEIGKGTGLGLASVYGIVKSHSGHISCYSEEGQGTVFKIYLPAMEQIGGAPVTNASLGLHVGGNETILLVDDDESIRGFAGQTLQRFGYTVLAASTGEEALEIFSGKPGEIDLVIMDIGMPGMGGHKCLAELLKIDPSAKVIIASGYSINGQVKKTLDAGAVGYIGKPYQLAVLLEKVRDVLDKKE